MFRSNKRHKELTRVFASLWRNWALAVGLLTLVTVLSPLVPRHTLPLFTLFLAVGLRLYERRGRAKRQLVCFRFTRQVWLILILSAGAMAVLNLAYMHSETELMGQPVNYELPFLSILVVAPIAAMVNGYALLRGTPPMCRDCVIQWDDADLGFVGCLYRREWLYQTRLGFALALASLIADWVYYFFFFSTVNFSIPDYFFYIWLPCGIFVASLIYLGMRYYSLWLYYCHKDEAGLVNNPSRTLLRFLVVSDGKLLLRKDGKTGLYDTPFVATIDYEEKPNILEINNVFRNISNLTHFNLRYLYTTPDPFTFHNTFHYFCFLPSNFADTELDILQPQEGDIDEWLPSMAVRQLHNHGELDIQLRREIERIYRVALAWKTYDNKGHRLYPIKNYRPTFRFSDIPAWDDLDFSDNGWLEVYHLNEDMPFFKIRRLWRGFTLKLANVTNP